MKTDDADEIDLASLSRSVWRFRRMTLAVSLIFGLLFGIYAFTAKPIFRAQVVVTAARDRSSGGMGGLASQFGGLASLAGLELNPGATGAMQESAAILESRNLAQEFIMRNGLLPELRRASDANKTLWRAVDNFKKDFLSIVKDQRKGVTTVAVEWTDPAVAAAWANAYVALANELVRNRTIAESTRNIGYLNEQLAKTSDVELRKVMYNLIESETKTLMIANGRSEYAFEVVDPAVTPELKVRPHRLYTVLTGLVVGFGFAVILAVLRDRIGRKRVRPIAVA